MANPTLFLATLDETLAFVDTGAGGTLTAVDPQRYAVLGAQHGVWVEEAATNLAINTVVASNSNGWGPEGTPTLTRVDTTATLGDWSLQAVRAASSGTQGVFSNHNVATWAVTADESYTMSCYAVSNVPVTNAGARIDWFTSTPTYISSASANNQVIGVDPADPSRLLVTATAPATADRVRVAFSTPSGTIGDTQQYTRFQLEQSSYPTSFFHGGSGDGYAFTGTAHASTSTRAASSVSVDQNGTARIDPASGAIAFRYKRLIDTGAEEVILTSGVAGSGTDYLEIGVDTSDDLYMEWNSNNAGAERVTIATTIAVDTDYFFYFDWDGTTIRSSIDNGALSSDTRAAAEGDWSTGDLTLSAAVGSHVVGPFLIGDRPLTSKEIATLNARSTWGFSTLRSGNRYNIFQLRPRAA